MFTSRYPRRPDHRSLGGGGHNHLDREARLCHVDGAPESRNLPGIDAINGFVENIMRNVNGLLSPQDAREQVTQRNLSNPNRWIQAFGRAEVFTEPQTTRASLNGQAFGPQELLATMSVEDRVRHFYDFARAVLPARVADRLLPAGAGRPPVPDEARKETVLNTTAIVLGLRRPGPGAPEIAFAREAFDEIYPEGQMGFIYQDYTELVREIMRITTPAGRPSAAQLQDREQLLKLAEERANQMPQGRFRRFIGWLRVSEGDPAAMKLTQARLTVLGNQRQRNELSQDQNKLKTHQMMEKLQDGPRLDAERRNRNFMDNFNMMEPWQQYAVIGLGLFAAYKMWNSKSKLFGVIPMWTIPTGVVGLYLYRRLVMGDQDAINTMTSAVQRGVNTVTDAGRGILNRGILPPTIEEQDQKTLAMMSQFLDQNAFLSQFPVAAPMMTIAQVRMRSLAGNAFRAQLTPGGIQYSLYAGPRDPLYIEAQGIIKNRRYNRDTLHRIFYENNAQIAQGVGNVFYQLAARRPENRDRVKIIEDARRGGARFSPTGVGSLSYDNIREPAVKQMYIDMMEAGRVIALEQHPNDSLVDIIARFVNEGRGTAERQDNADRVPVPNMLDAPQRALLETRNSPLTPEREASVKLIRAEFRGFIDNCRRPNMRVLNAAAAEDLTNFADRLLDDATKPLPEVLQILERVKYAILVAAAARGGGGAANELGIDDVAQMIGAADSADRFNLTALPGTIGSFINSRLRVFAGFQQIQNIGNVKALIGNGFFSGLTTGPGRLTQLDKQLTAHQQRFSRMRDSNRAAEIFANALPPTTVNRFHASEPPDSKIARANLITFLQRMIASPQYQAFINQGEQYYAQRVTNDIVMAQITTHNRTGAHALENDPNERFVSPIEEQNLIANNEFLLTNVIGSEARPLNGMWAAMNMRQLLIDFGPAFNAETEPARMQGVENTRRMAWLFVSLQPLVSVETPMERIDLEVRNRVRTVADGLINHFYVESPAGSKAAEEVKQYEEERKTLNKQAVDLEAQLKEQQAKKLLAEAQVTQQALIKVEWRRQDIQEEMIKVTVALHEARRKYRADLLNQASYRDGVPDIINTMHLLDMTADAADQQRVKRFEDMRIPLPEILPPAPPPTIIPAAIPERPPILQPADGQPVRLLPPATPDRPIRLNPAGPDQPIILQPQAGNRIELLPPGTALNASAPRFVQPQPGQAPVIIQFQPGTAARFLLQQNGAPLQLLPTTTPGQFQILPANASAAQYIHYPQQPTAAPFLPHNPTDRPMVLQAPAGNMALVVIRADGRVQVRPLPATIPAGTTPLLQPQTGAAAVDLAPPASGEREVYLQLQTGTGVFQLQAMPGNRWNLLPPQTATVQPIAGAATVDVMPRAGNQIILQQQPGQQRLLLERLVGGELRVHPAGTADAGVGTIAQPAAGSAAQVLDIVPGQRTVIIGHVAGGRVIVLPTANGNQFQILPFDAITPPPLFLAQPAAASSHVLQHNPADRPTLLQAPANGIVPVRIQADGRTEVLPTVPAIPGGAVTLNQAAAGLAAVELTPPASGHRDVFIQLQPGTSVFQLQAVPGNRWQLLSPQNAFTQAAVGGGNIDVTPTVGTEILLQPQAAERDVLVERLPTGQLRIHAAQTAAPGVTVIDQPAAGTAAASLDIPSGQRLVLRSRVAGGRQVIAPVAGGTRMLLIPAQN